MDSGEYTSNASQLIPRIGQLAKPAVQLILSGKRKCGKDFLEQIILERYPNSVLSYRISGPIKGAFARQNGLDFAQLLTASTYKETYRQQMVTWSESIRATDPHYFLRLAILEAADHETKAQEPRPIWLLNDARRPTDLHYFTDQSEIDMSGTSLITLRITSSNQTRTERGWKFTEGIDDQTTECGLDGVTQWDVILENNGTKEELLEKLEPLFQRIDGLVKGK